MYVHYFAELSSSRRTGGIIKTLIISSWLRLRIVHLVPCWGSSVLCATFFYRISCPCCYFKYKSTFLISIKLALQLKNESKGMKQTSMRQKDLSERVGGNHHHRLRHYIKLKFSYIHSCLAYMSISSKCAANSIYAWSKCWHVMSITCTKILLSTAYITAYYWNVFDTKPLNIIFCRAKRIEFKHACT